MKNSVQTLPPATAVENDFPILGDDVLVDLSLSVAQAQAISDILRERLSHAPRTRLEHDLGGLRDFLADIVAEHGSSSFAFNKD